MRWCDGSWTEDQDFWRLSGVARDSYLFAREKNRSIEDIVVTPDLDASYTDGAICVETKVGKEIGIVIYTLYDANGVEVAKHIHDMLTCHGLPTKVLAASFKNTQQVLSLCEYGIGSITAAPDVLMQLINHQMTASAIQDFKKDFSELVGDTGKTMHDF